MPLSISLASSEDKLQWDNYVLKHGESSPYHLYGWKEAVENAYEFKSYYLIAEDQERIVGILPLFFLTFPLMRSGNLIALPYCDVGGPLANDGGIEEALIRSAVDLGLQLQAKHIELRGAAVQSALVYTGFAIEEKSEKVRMILTLPGSSDDLWQSFRSKLRSQINKAGRNGLKFIFSQDLEEFYRIFAANMHELGSPVHSYRWLEAIFQGYGDRAHLGLIYSGQKAIAGGVLLNTDRQVSIPWASTKRKCNHLSPNMLLYWNFLKYSIDRGFSVFDFGRSTEGEGTYRFKSQWGAQPIPLVWNMLHLRKKIITGTNTAKQGVAINASGFQKRAIAAKLWRLLPAGFVNRTGPVIRKFISL